MNWFRRLLAHATCLVRGHRWHHHRYVGDWFCDHCRLRRQDIGIRR